MAGLRSEIARRVHGYCLAQLGRRARPQTKTELSARSLVVAPHPDDETLGCGGTIAQRSRAGSEVGVVFMTDGSSSPDARIPSETLRQRRRLEARAAVRVLTGKSGQATFLDYPDGALARYQTEAAARLETLLAERQPDHLFIPSRRDGHSDHVATQRIVLRAVTRSWRPVVVYEYPVWFWRHLPWTGLDSTLRQTTEVLRSSLKSGFGLRLLYEFREILSIESTLDVKRAALAEHRSQTAESGAGGPTLADVDNGQFLRCLVQDFEPFHRYVVGPWRGH